MTTSQSNEMYTYSDLQGFAKVIRDKTDDIKPTIGIICGTGLGGLADILEDKISIPYTDITNFPVSTVKGHHGEFVVGKLEGKIVICMKGRFHLYEGYPPWKLTAPVRVMALLGVKTLIVTNAAGGINRKYKVGDIMLMSDHVFFPGLAGLNPLVGPNLSEFGERFVDTSRLYDAGLRNMAKQIAHDCGYADFLQEGVYAMVGGPSFETPAELRLLSTVSDVVGMSTCPEAIVAKHCGLRVFGMSLVTNQGVMEQDKAGGDGPTHCEVLEMGNIRKKVLQNLVTKLVGKM